MLRRHAPLLFLRSLLQDPLRVGAVAPSSSGLSRLMVSRVDPNESVVLELGAGTGAMTRALLKHGVKRNRIVVIERDPSLARYLREQFPGVHVRCADAVDIRSILAADSIGPVKTVVSSLPLRSLPREQQHVLVRAMVDTLCPNGQLLQFTYAGGCPIPSRRFGMRAECLGRVWMNLPPAAVWRFTRESSISGTWRRS
jgi:phosphatidylethanolamine/phosphatidyl-N-methylethanolamine N-methyltransferase